MALLDPSRHVSAVDAVVLSGGSAFGLAASVGVVDYLESQNRGFETPYARVPIVVGLSLFDLGVGDGSVRPGPAEGRAAAVAATAGPIALGQVGAGTGATVGKWAGRELATPGGLGSATLRHGDVIVSALIAVNAVGFIDDGTSTADIGPPAFTEPHGEELTASENTTIGVIATNAAVDKQGCHLLAQSGHDGLARALLPAHTLADGDALVAASVGDVEAEIFHLRLLAQQVVAAAVRSVGLGPSRP